MEHTKIFSGTSNIPLTEAVCKYLDVLPGKAEIRRFSDGEISANISPSLNLLISAFPGKTSRYLQTASVRGIFDVPLNIFVCSIDFTDMKALKVFLLQKNYYKILHK